MHWRGIAARQSATRNVIVAKSRVVGRHVGPYLGMGAVAFSPILAIMFVISHFGTRGTLSAIGQSNGQLLAVATAMGVYAQILRAQRARRLLLLRYPISLRQSYSSMVVGHGIGDLVPFAPSGPALRCLLTERAAQIPVAFSAGAFMVEGVLDGLGVALLSGYLLVALSLPAAERLILLSTLIPLLLLVGFLVVPHANRFRGRGRHSAHMRWPAAERLFRELGSGLTVLSGAGVGAVLRILALSLAVSVISGAQIALFLIAFGLHLSSASALLLIVLTLAAGSVPIKFPGSGTVTSTAALAISGLHGPGAAGYILVSRAVLSSQATVLALIVLTTWAVLRRRATSPLGARIGAITCSVTAEYRRAALAASSGLIAAFGSLFTAFSIHKWRNSVMNLNPVWRTGSLVALAAVTVRLTALAITGGTYDPDEFVVLELGRAVAHGAIPYRDITYFHPPGMLYLVAVLQPLIQWWWPVSRLAILTIDCSTCVFVWWIGRQLFNERTALIAGLAYAISPLSVISAIRVGPDPVITALGVFGLIQMLRRESRSGPIIAGLCLAVGVWIKYPALLFLPIYIAAAPRAARRMLLTFGAGTVALFAPFLVDAHAFVTDTIGWQVHGRDSADVLHRMASVGIYWLGLNFLALFRFLRGRCPLWLGLGFCCGAVFMFTAQAYYHYFVPVIPFAALLAAPTLRPIFDRWTRLILVASALGSVLWYMEIGYGPPLGRLYVSAAQFTTAEKTAAIIDSATSTQARILTDQFEYAMFASRSVSPYYFWNMNRSVSAASLEQRLPGIAAVVQTVGLPNGYPPGFIDYLEDRGVPHIRTPGAIVWITHSRQVL